MSRLPIITPNRTRNVLIGVVSDDVWQADMASSLAAMCLHVAYNCPDIRILGIVNQKSSEGGTKGRNDLVKKALSIPEVTHILFIDSDMTFPPSALAMLMADNRQVIGCNALRRRHPYIPASQRGELGKWELGAAFMLIDVSIFGLLPFPWFEGGYRDGHYRDGDQNFCEKVNRLGTVYCHEQLSQLIGHLGQMNFSLKMHNNIKEDS